MNSIDVRWVITDSDVNQALIKLNLAGQNMADPFRDISRALKTSTQMRFVTHTAPDGHRWTPSQRVLKHGGVRLTLTARLRNAWYSRSDGNSATVGTNVAYARPLHYGFFGQQQVHAFTRMVRVVFGRRLKTPVKAEVKPFTRNGRLPRREILGLSAGDRSEILHIVDDYFSRIANRY